MRGRTAIGAALALAALFPPARAAAEPWPPPSVALPADGAERPASLWPAASPADAVGFALYTYAPFLPASFAVEVASGPDTDLDGTLADAATVDRLVATPLPGFTGIFAARTGPAARWTATPGTYFWQASTTRADCDPCVFASPVRRLVVRPRTPADDAAPDAGGSGGPASGGVPAAAGPAYLDVPRLTRAHARRAVRAEVRRRTGLPPRGLRARCALRTPFDATCRSSWRDASFRYRGTMFVWAGAGGTGASFSGTRTVRGCRRGCAAPLRWAP
jgi:hypothetical protein